MLRQQLKYKLSQKLSPQQIQLMKLIQLPTQAFEQRVKQELEENPALDLVENNATSNENIETNIPDKEFEWDDETGTYLPIDATDLEGGDIYDTGAPEWWEEDYASLADAIASGDWVTEDGEIVYDGEGNPIPAEWLGDHHIPHMDNYQERYPHHYPSSGNAAFAYAALDTGATDIHLIGTYVFLGQNERRIWT